MSEAKDGMDRRLIKLLHILPVLEVRLGDIMEENGIPRFYAHDAIRLLLAVYREKPDFEWVNLDNSLDF
ncbi:hypothetical protein MOR33_004002 [Salmonella enterica]|nr:hypothetical protein [Salmonella enterica]EGL7479694.1 hypothetical protein [Salmonella enterica]EIZ2335020.1 hypothetical protein [Salmonella enterica]